MPSETKVGWSPRLLVGSEDAVMLPVALVRELSKAGREEVAEALQACAATGDLQPSTHEGGKERVAMDQPCISIDRQSKRYAIFDGLTCVGEFKPYTDEAAAEAAARSEIAKFTDKEPEIVYPSITRMTMSSSRTRRRRS